MERSVIESGTEYALNGTVRVWGPWFRVVSVVERGNIPVVGRVTQQHRTPRGSEQTTVRPPYRLASVAIVREEEGGYLADALGLAPELSPRAAALLRELNDVLRETVDHLGTDDSVGSGLNQLCRDFERFVQRLSEHEQSERSLIRQAIGDEHRAGE